MKKTNPIFHIIFLPLTLCVTLFARHAFSEDCSHLFRSAEINSQLRRLEASKNKNTNSTRRTSRKEILGALDRFEKEIDNLETSKLPTREQMLLLRKLEQLSTGGKINAFTQSEILYLRDNKAFRNLLNASLYIRNTLEPAQIALESLSRFLTLRGSLVRTRGNPTILKNALAHFGSVAHSTLNFLSPIEFRPLFNPVSDIFIAQSAGKTLSRAERETLLRYNALSEYKARAALIKKYPNWHQAKLFNRSARLRIKQVGFVFSIVLAVELGFGEPMLSAEDYLERSKDLADRNEVQILNETSPFPHTAIRIGNQVFSYGQTTMTKSSVSRFLSLEQIQALFGDPADSPNTSIEKYTAGQSRSLQVFTLKLAPNEIAKLERYLNEQTGKNYENITHANDCSTMVSRAIRSNTSLKIPTVIDPSPFWLESYFLAQKYMGPKETVTSVALVLLNESKSSNAHLARNALINYAEGRIYQASFFIQQGRRISLDATRKSSEIQYWNEASEKIISEWKEEARSAVENDATLTAVLEEIPKAKSNADRELLRKLGVATLTEKMDAAKSTLLLNPSADLQEIVAAKATLEPLRQKIRSYMRVEELNEQMIELLTELDSLAITSESN